MSQFHIQKTLFNPQEIQVGISACLLGKQVRFDGGHKYQAFVDKALSPYFSFKSICPEMAIGMGAPRPAIRQIAKDDLIFIQGSQQTDLDVTSPLTEFSHQQASQLSGLSGYIVCAKSPTCGMERVKVYNEQGQTIHNKGVGIFTQALKEANPLLPIEESGRLNDPVLRENFINRVFAYHEWQSLMAKGLTAHSLLEFHARYKYLLMASSVDVYRQLGPMLANLKPESLESIASEYIQLFMKALTQRASRRSHTNVLLHLQGYFKKQMDSAERQALASTIHSYRMGLLPLLAPMTLIKHLLVKFPNEYLAQQKYLNPHPESLALRSSL